MELTRIKSFHPDQRAAPTATVCRSKAGEQDVTRSRERPEGVLRHPALHVALSSFIPTEQCSPKKVLATDQFWRKAAPPHCSTFTVTTKRTISFFQIDME